MRVVRLVMAGAAVLMSGCYASHTTFTRGVWSRTVAFGPAASVRVKGGEIEATTVRSPTAAMTGGAFVGAAVGSFLKTRF